MMKKDNIYYFLNSFNATIGKCDCIEIAEKHFKNDIIIKKVIKNNIVIMER